MRQKPTFIFTFTTGRTGTAMLTQLFGLEKYSKKKLYFTDNNRNVVAHEPWNDVPVHLLKKLEPGSIESDKICHDFLMNQRTELLKKAPGLKNIFITDHKMGRYFTDYLIQSDQDYRIAVLIRNKDEVVPSFLAKMAKKRKGSTAKQYHYFVRRLWKSSLYSPFDVGALHPIDPIDWTLMTDEQRIGWYFDEVKRKWDRLSGIIPHGRFVEIGFENIVNGNIRDDDGNIIQNSEVKKLGGFIGLPYKRAMLDIKVNAR